MDDTFDDDDTPAILFGAALALFGIGTLIYNFGRVLNHLRSINWAPAGFVVSCVVFAALGLGLLGYAISNAVEQYRASELYRYRKARRDIKRITRAGKKQIRSLGR